VIAAARERRVGLHGIGTYRGDPDTAAPSALGDGHQPRWPLQHHAS